MQSRSWVSLLAALLFALLLAFPATAHRYSSSKSSTYRYSHGSTYTHKTYHSPKIYTLPKTHSSSTYHTKSLKKYPSSHSSKTYYPRPSKKSASPQTSAYTKSSTTKSKYCKTCARDSHGHIKRSEQAREAFKHSHPCPSTGKSSGPCPGYVIDHVKALKHGGADDPSNMQWQTKGAAKEKDKWE